MTLEFLVSYIGLWILVLFQGLLTIALLRQLTELRNLASQGALSSDEILPEGTRAPEFAGIDVRSGKRISNKSINQHGAVLVFLSPECDMCKSLATSLRRPAVDALPEIIVFCQGQQQDCAYFEQAVDPDLLLLRESNKETATRYRVFTYPTAVVIDHNQQIRGYDHPPDIAAIQTLVARTSSLFQNQHVEAHSLGLNSEVAQ